MVSIGPHTVEREGGGAILAAGKGEGLIECNYLREHAEGGANRTII